VRAVVNRAWSPPAVAREAGEAVGRPGALAPTPLRALDGVARALGVGAVDLKDESARGGLPAFKVLGASWAAERAIAAARAPVTTLVAASAGNHGRAVAHVARTRGLRCRVFLPARSSAARRAAIAGEGAEIVVVDGTYEDAVAAAQAAGAEPGLLEIADVGHSAAARWVIEGYAALFAEVAIASYDVVVVPVGVGSLGAAAARAAAPSATPVIAVEPATAACLGASLAAGAPVVVPTPGTTMAGLDCAAVSPAAWPDLRAGIAGAIAISDAETHAAMADLAALGLAIGDCGAAPLAALRALARDPECAGLRDAVAFGPRTRALLIATEGVTDPEAYAAVVGRVGGREPKSGRSSAPS
jgi:diaminopropionate ammonia-lyase